MRDILMKWESRNLMMWSMAAGVDQKIMGLGLDGMIPLRLMLVIMNGFGS